MTELKKITIHRALTELKTLDSRIAQATRDVVLVTPHRTQNDKINNVPVEHYQKQMQGSYDKAISLIAYRNRVKDAIVQSNAVTEVVVAGETMTVAKAIERKESIKYEESLYATLYRQFREANAVVNRADEEMPKKLETYLVNILGNREKASAEDIKLHTEAFTKMNKVELIDPMGAEKILQALNENIIAFKADVDATLSESNATTFIEIEA